MGSIPKGPLRSGDQVSGTGEFRSGRRSLEVPSGDGICQGGRHSAWPLDTGGRSEAEPEFTGGEDCPATGWGYQLDLHLTLVTESSNFGIQVYRQIDCCP